MIRVTLLRRGGRPAGFVSRGHAGFADAGSDIVCSAVSVLLINTVNSIETLTEDHFEAEQSDGFLRLVVTEGAGEKTLLLLRSLELGLRSVEEEYGPSFLQIGETEA